MVNNDLLRTRQKKGNKSREVKDRRGLDQQFGADDQSLELKQSRLKLKKEIEMIESQVSGLKFEEPDMNIEGFRDSKGGKNGRRGIKNDAIKRTKTLLSKLENLGFENFELKEQKDREKKTHFYINEELEVDLEAIELLKNDFLSYKNKLIPLKEKHTNSTILFEEQAVNLISKAREASEVKYSLFKRALSSDRAEKIQKFIEIYETMIEALKEMQELYLDINRSRKEYHTVNKILNSDFHMLKVKSQILFREILGSEVFKMKNSNELYDEYSRRVEADFEYFVSQDCNKNFLKLDRYGRGDYKVFSESPFV